MPVNGDFLAECGDSFGTSAETLLYCGPFILSTFEPQVQRVLTKNPTYWDIDNVFIDTCLLYTSSPYCLSGTPMTCTSLTAGWV